MTQRYIQILDLDFSQSEIEFTFPLKSSKGKHYINCDFSSILFDSTVEVRGKFRNCNFVNCEFLETSMQGEFENCNFAGAQFDKVEFKSPEFKRSIFAGSIFRENKSLYQCSFFKGCNFDYSSGVEVSGPFTDENLLVVYKKTESNGVPKYLATEKTDKIDMRNSDLGEPYDTYEVNGVKDLRTWSMTKHGRRSIGFVPDSAKNTNITYGFDLSAILICSKKGLV